VKISVSAPNDKKQRIPNFECAILRFKLQKINNTFSKCLFKIFDRMIYPTFRTQWIYMLILCHGRMVYGWLTKNKAAQRTKRETADKPVNARGIIGAASEVHKEVRGRISLSQHIEFV